MKRILLASIMLIANILARPLFGAYGKMDRAPHAKMAQGETNYHTATKNADQLLQEFAMKSTAQDIDNLAKYFEYYKSWGFYDQSATQAPRDLEASLSAAARTLVQEIKQLADLHFTRKRSSAGVSPLTQKGDKFYRHVERKLQYLAQQKKS